VNPLRRTGVLAGILFLVTHVTSVGAVALYGPMLTDAGWMDSDASGLAQRLGAVLDVILAIAVVGTAVALLPVLRRPEPRSASAYLALRTLEASVILLGAVAVLGALAVRGQHAAGSDAAGVALLALYRAAFLVGPGLVIGANTLVLAAALRRTRLVPVWIPVLGLVGAPLVVLSNLAVLFGLQSQVSPTAALAAVPIFAWEISLAVYLIVRGPRAATRADAPDAVGVAAG